MGAMQREASTESDLPGIDTGAATGEVRVGTAPHQFHYCDRDVKRKILEARGCPEQAGSVTHAVQCATCVSAELWWGHKAL